MTKYRFKLEDITNKQGVELPNENGDLIWYPIKEIKSWETEKLQSFGITAYEDPIVELSPTEEELTKNTIAELESQITQRRLREAILGLDNGWLASLESQIASLRVKV